MSDDEPARDPDEPDFARLPGPWVAQALCSRHPEPHLWFPERGADVAAARAICRVCPVKDECLAFAVETGEKFGIWGGRSERERRRMRKAIRSPKGGTAA